MKKTIKKYFNLFKFSFETEKQKEYNYYKKLFVENNNWNTINPNDEEILRWKIIKDFVESINLKDDFNNNFILDLGCGRGWLTNLLSNYGKIIGVEPIKPVVDYAKKIFPEITFICGTSKDLLKNKNSKKFNLIVVSEVIEHIPDKNKDEFIKDLTRLIENNGFLIITTPRKEAQKEWSFYCDPNQPVEDWISEAELEKLVLKKDFIKLRLERFSISPIKDAPEIEIYQLWLFQKKIYE
jgi:2-polyprenyl-3-methyl-5-hydroxy-6-metoxy-1,4-benzoquinol methylase